MKITAIAHSFAVLALGVAATVGVRAQTSGADAARAALPQGGDPVLPAAARKAPLHASPSGAALDAAVEAKLRATFAAADTARSGTLTRDQAQRAGWGMVVMEFERIDTRRSGRVSFDDILRYLRSRAASR